MIEFDMVGLRYGVEAEVLSDVSFTLAPSSFHFLSGPSGAGKTSLMRLLYLGMAPSRGKVSMFKRDVSKLDRHELCTLRQKIGVVFQEFRLLAHLNIFDNVALPLRITGTREAQIKDYVEELLQWVGLGDHMKRLPHTLSGGQQQRVAIARAVIAKPDLLLADEPTGNLDDEIGYKLMTLFQQLNQTGTTIVIATHNETMMEQFAYPKLVLQDKTISVEMPAPPKKTGT